MNNHSDERTTAVAHRWAAIGWLILTFALGVDLMVRILVLKQEPQQWADISLIWMATMLFAGVGMTASGVEPYGGKRSKLWLVVLVFAVGITLVSALMGKIHSLADLISTTISAAAGAFMALIILRVIHGAWERRTLGRELR